MLVLVPYAHIEAFGMPGLYPHTKALCLHENFLLVTRLHACTSALCLQQNLILAPKL